MDFLFCLKLCGFAAVGLIAAVALRRELAACHECVHGTDPHEPDSDGDGLNDGWEILYGLDPRVDNALSSGTGTETSDDPDGDGLSNRWEALLGTDPYSADTDNDGSGGDSGEI